MSEVIIIAELGINHNGSTDTAIKLIDHAANSGCHAVKFQYRNLTNAYSATVKEIGDEILYREIHANHLAPDIILQLSDHAKKLGMKVGISFFEKSDMADFGIEITKFDFFKLPSAELNNYILLDALIDIGKHVYISTGCHYENEIKDAFKRLPDNGWTPMHCTSNYPTAIQNPKLGYLAYLKNHWDRDIGYSSHDEHWEVCLVAMQMGATVIERHISLDKHADGLDHSSSSTPDEFEKLCLFASNMEIIKSGDLPRVPNQGELLNRQNLGRSFFLNRDVKSGETINMEDLDYRSPNIGISISEIDEFIGQSIAVNSPSGVSLTRSMFKKYEALPNEVIDFAKVNRIALPVRLHDYSELIKQFPITAYEFHLSFREVQDNIDVTSFDWNKEYSIHLPDYINSTKLMDPFSNDRNQRKASIDILERTVQFAKKLQDITGKEVPVVGSFSVIHDDIDNFYQNYSSLLSDYMERGVIIVLQWLPPIAWYFGGSVQLDVMNQERDINYLNKFNIPICMDICHLLMGKSYYKFNPYKMILQLSQNIKHLHIADSAGIDGEGLQIGDGEPENTDLIKKILNYDCLKVIEVWQGHLDQGAGFRESLKRLYQLYQ